MGEAFVLWMTSCKAAIACCLYNFAFLAIERAYDLDDLEIDRCILRQAAISMHIREGFAYYLSCTHACIIIIGPSHSSGKVSCS